MNTTYRLERPRPAQHLPISRNVLIALGVVALHVVLLWALQSGLLVRTVELIVPAEVLSQFIDPPTPKAEPIAAPAVPEVQKRVVAKTPVQPQVQQALVVKDNTSSPDTSPSVVVASPALPPAPSVPAAPPVAASPTRAVVQLPSSDADYLQNPKPPYPSLSKNLGEQGTTIYKVLIGVDGRPQSAKLVKSSGFARLDNASYKAVMSWRYVPGKRNGVPEAMEFDAPVVWELEN